MAAYIDGEITFFHPWIVKMDISFLQPWAAPTAGHISPFQGFIMFFWVGF
jgi:hypothetical protein